MFLNRLVSALFKEFPTLKSVIVQKKKYYMGEKHVQKQKWNAFDKLCREETFAAFNSVCPFHN